VIDGRVTAAGESGLAVAKPDAKYPVLSCEVQVGYVLCTALARRTQQPLEPGGRLIPLRDENPTEIVPFINYLFIAANIGAFLVLQGGGDPQALRAAVETFGVVPCEITGNCPAEGLRYPSVLTSMFMHGGWGHLLLNMLFLWVFGNNIEDSMGHLRYIVFYLVCGVAAAMAQIILVPESRLPMVGASGAVSGVMGAYILLYPRVRVRVFFPPIFLFNLRAGFILGYWLVIQLVQGFLVLQADAAEEGGVAFWAHIGGFIAGLVLIKPFEKQGLTSAKREKRKLTREEVAKLEW
jgi:membrane associated rhomboid family serine protease